MKRYIEAEIGQPITEEQHRAIFTKAWDDGHSSGYSEVLLCASDIIEVVKKFVLNIHPG